MSINQGRLTSILQQEASTLEDLYSVLMKELVALKDRNTESIGMLSEEKDKMLNKLAMLDKERQRCAENNEENNTSYTDDISELNNEIEFCLEKCKRQNSINGGIIEMSQLFNEKMLNIICGNFDNDNTYSASGKNNIKNNLHSLGRV
jgi:flagellar biosynthesis protein FlgN